MPGERYLVMMVECPPTVWFGFFIAEVTQYQNPGTERIEYCVRLGLHSFVCRMLNHGLGMALRQRSRYRDRGIILNPSKFFPIRLKLRNHLKSPNLIVHVSLDNL